MKAHTDMKSILNNNKSEMALVIGNGINLFGPSKDKNSWNDLLVKLAKKHLPKSLNAVPAGVAMTEFYDVLELKSKEETTGISLQEKFCELMSSWQYFDQHQRIVSWAQNAKRPILTTNFEQILSDAGRCNLYRTTRKGFTDFYPWETYYGLSEFDNPIGDFGIWHINGMQRYKRSIRLGLTHYMGSVERARGWIHKGEENRLFAGKNSGEWQGASSWLHVIFNCPLLIFGLKLDENEVFLRWLLIERARYFKKFKERRKRGWYVYSGEKNNDGKQYFLEGVGIDILHVSDYEDIYGADVWQ